MTTISSLYSIGHGQKIPSRFIDELRAFGIQFLVDVRSNPYSKWAAHFNLGTIEQWLASNGVRYAYMGDSIGGKPLNEDCYDEEGYFDYCRMAKEPRFIAGLQRLVNANAQHCRVAVMCSESDPQECHRSKLIGRELYFVHHIEMNHIVAVNESVSQEEIMTSLTKGRWEPNGDLFGDCEPPFFKSCKAYRQPAGMVAEDFVPYD